jgi:PPOX class probable F420-dependent enzyme
MVTLLDPEAEAFVKGNTFGILVALRRDGRPQPTPVGYCYHEGRLLISSARKFAKYKNLKRDSRAALCILSEEHRYMTVYGQAEVVEDERRVYELSNIIFRSYGEHGREQAESPDFSDWLRSRSCIVIAIRPEEIVKQPPGLMSGD